MTVIGIVCIVISVLFMVSGVRELINLGKYWCHFDTCYVTVADYCTGDNGERMLLVDVDEPYEPGQAKCKIAKKFQGQIREKYPIGSELLAMVSGNYPEEPEEYMAYAVEGLSTAYESWAGFIEILVSITVFIVGATLLMMNIF